MTWRTDCAAGYCGNSQATYSAGAAEPADGATSDPANCSATLPTGSVIVDDLPTAAPGAAAPCHSLATAGSFAFTFTADANGNYPAHIDLHQINGGLNGHYWFSHTVQTNDLTVETGTWTFPSTTTGNGHLMVHQPALGAQTPQAQYTIIDGKSGATQTRTLAQGWGSNHWYDLGSFTFSANEKIRLTNHSPKDSSGTDIAYDAVAFVPKAKPTYKVVGLGDSYSAGEGLQPFYANSDNSIDSCHRSSQAYVNLVTLPNQTTTLGSTSADELDFIACSGSQSTSITSDAVSTGTQEVPPGSGWGRAQNTHDEAQQVLEGYLDANTDAVTLSIGGNDVRFADVLKSCSVTGANPFTTGCSANGYTMSGDSQPLNQFEPHIIRDLLPTHLEAVYAAIHSAAPNAAIFVVGYPHLFPTTTTGQANCPSDLTVIPADQTWLNSMADLMTAAISQSVAAVAAHGVNIHFVDPTATFTGHDVCAGSAAYVNAIIATSTSGSGTDAPGRGTFHPKSSGQAAYARLVTAAMKQWLPAK